MMQLGNGDMENRYEVDNILVCMS